MKALFTIICLSALSFNSITEAQIRSESSDFDQIYEENILAFNSWWRTIKLNGEHLSFKERRSIMMKYPNSSKYYQQHQNLERVMLPIAAGSLTTMLISMNRQRRLGEQYNGNKDGWMISSTALCVGFIVLDIISTSKLRKAVNAYNKEVLRELW